MAGTVAAKGEASMRVCGCMGQANRTPVGADPRDIMWRSCEKPHGHDGDCDFVIRRQSDDQLRAEWLRRHPEAADVRDFYSRTMTDAELRAECERRRLGPYDPKWIERLTAADATNARLNTLLAEEFRIRCDAQRERDEWKKRYDEILADRDQWRRGPDPAGIARIVAERDEWKRRAEDAERATSEMAASLANRTTIERLTRGAAKGLDDLLAKASGTLYGLPKRVETGPGIAATKPDNSVAWLDEDLLCEDAK